MKSPLSFLASGLLAFLSTATATEIHVNASTGDDGAKGTKESPFKTITRAVNALTPGDHVLVEPGTYRETVPVIGGGSKENPAIVEASDPAKRPTITGADAITGWKPLVASGLPEASHPHAAQIYYADTDFVPEFLFVGARQQFIAREPNSGWFSASTDDGKTISSDQLAGVTADNLEGTQIFYFLAKGVEQQLADVKGWAGTKGGPIEMATPLFGKQHVTFTEGDRFYMQNHLDFLDQAGDWVVKKSGAGSRIFWWPPTKEALDHVEAPRRDTVVDLTKANYVTVRGFDICHAAKSSSGSGIGIPSAHLADGQREGLTIESCSIYQNQRFGVRIEGCRDVTLRRCLVADNSYGVTISHSRHVLVEENEIAWDLNDGLVIAWDTEDAIVHRNAIHHHSRFSHPDNFQTYRGVKNVLLDSNVLVASGQSAHTQQTVDLTARNNLFMAPSANSFFTAGPDTKNTGTQKEGGGYTLENNTFSLFPNGAIVLIGTGHKFEGNIFDIRGGKYGYGGDVTPDSIVSKNNRFAISHSEHANLAGFKGKGLRFNDLEKLQKDTGLEEGSVFGDPQFASIPDRVADIDGKKIAQCTESRLFLDYDSTEPFKAGDHIEFDFDGIDRVVKDADGESIVFAPPLASAPLTTVTVTNWGAKPVGKIDLRTKDKHGANLNFEAYLRGDFNDDGQRDAAPWPDGLSSPRQSH
ncbi:hypothetical protein BH09VER1_BH09VER1_12910 [soil metagenome]